MTSCEQKKNYLHKEAVCLLYVQIRTKSNKQHTKRTFIPRFKFMPFNSVLNLEKAKSSNC